MKPSYFFCFYFFEAVNCWSVSVGDLVIGGRLGLKDFVKLFKVFNLLKTFLDIFSKVGVFFKSVRGPGVCCRV